MRRFSESNKLSEKLKLENRLNEHKKNLLVKSLSKFKQGLVQTKCKVCLALTFSRSQKLQRPRRIHHLANPLQPKVLYLIQLLKLQFKNLEVHEVTALRKQWCWEKLTKQKNYQTL